MIWIGLIVVVGRVKSDEGKGGKARQRLGVSGSFMDLCVGCIAWCPLTTQEPGRNWQPLRAYASPSASPVRSRTPGTRPAV
jgi:hypothetical protein